MTKTNNAEISFIVTEQDYDTPEGIEIILIKKNIWYYLWRYSNGLIPYIRKRKIIIKLNGIDSDQPTCSVEGGNYEMWSANFGRCVLSWWNIEVPEYYMGHAINE